MGNEKTPSKATTGQRYTAPTSPKAPRIYVTDSNGSVESHIYAAGGVVIRPSYTPEQCIRDLQSCDGLLITGGGDVNPEIYGQPRHSSVYGVSTARDLRELSVLGAARDLGMPVLGICRGMQIINVEAGGTLYQNVPDKVHHQDHGFSMMPVITQPGSLVARALGDRPDMLHLHHQSVRKLAKGFTVTARHADGIVEAIESVDGRVIGVQFHPESSVGSGNGHNGYRLFEMFVNACTRYRRRVSTVGRTILPDASKYMNAWPVAVAAHELARWPVVVGKTGGGASPKGNNNGNNDVSAGGKSTDLVLVKGGKESTTIDQGIAGWCGPCGIPFDDDRDWLDHTEWFHGDGWRR